MAAASVAVAQQVALEVDPPANCGSVVIVKCDRPAANAESADPARQNARNAEVRRQSPLAQELEGVVIYGDAIRRRSIEETMAPAFPVLRARDGNYTFDTGEGSKCTCMNVCPPFPFPCCVCSPRTGR